MESEKELTKEGNDVSLLETGSRKMEEKVIASNDKNEETVGCSDTEKVPTDSSPKENIMEGENKVPTDTSPKENKMENENEEVPQPDNLSNQDMEASGTESGLKEVSQNKENVNADEQKYDDGEKSDTANSNQPPQDDADDILSNINNFINNISSEAGDKKDCDTETSKEDAKDTYEPSEQDNETGVSESTLGETPSDKTESEKQQVKSPQPESNEQDKTEIKNNSPAAENMETSLDASEPEKKETEDNASAPEREEEKVELSPTGKEDTDMDVSEPDKQLDITESATVEKEVDSQEQEKRDGQLELSETGKNGVESPDNLQRTEGASETDVTTSGTVDLEKESENETAEDIGDKDSNMQVEENLEGEKNEAKLGSSGENEGEKDLSETPKESEQDKDVTHDKEKQSNEESKMDSEEKEDGASSSDIVIDSTAIDQNQEKEMSEPMEVDVALDENKENSFEVEKASSVSPKSKGEEENATSNQSEGDSLDLQITSVSGSVTKKGDAVIDLDEAEESKNEKADQKKPIDIGEDKKPKILKTESKEEDEKPTTKDTKPVSKVQECVVCKKVTKCKFNIVRNGDIKHLCDDACFKVFRANPSSFLRSDSQEKSATFTKSPSMPDLCHNCGAKVVKERLVLVSNNGELPFCSNRCVTAHKKKLKLCACCQKDVSSDANAFMAPVSGGTEFKDFCSQLCLQKYEEMGITRKDTDLSQVSGLKMATCVICKQRKSIKHEVTIDTKVHTLCSDACFQSFRYSNKLTISNCEQCSASLQKPGVSVQTIQHEGVTKKMCSLKCVLVYKSLKTRLVPCAWCRAKKSNFDMVERVDENNKCQLFCSLNCLSLFRVNLQATSNTNVPCDYCHKASPAQYHLTMSDASVRNFCSYNCVIVFQSQFSQPTSKGNSQPVKTGEIQSSAAQKALVGNTRTSSRQRAKAAKKQMEAVQSPQIGTQTGSIQISNVMSLAPQSSSPVLPKIKVPSNHRTPPSSSAQIAITTPPAQAPPPQKQIIIQPQAPKQVRNKSLMCKPFTQTKSTLCKPLQQTKACQTDESLNKHALIPVPIPIYVPVPMRMYSTPVPYPVPVPVPIPIPMFIPTTKKNADSILKHIKEIQERMPADPFEAEMLMMAEMVATEDKDSDSDSSDEDNDATPAIKSDVANYSSSQENVLAANDMGEDMLQMALRMAQEMPNEPILDVEESLQGSTINPDAPSGEFSTIDRSADIFTPEPTPPPTRRGRGAKRRGGGRGASTRSKRQKIEEPPPAQSPAAAAPVLQNAPDAGMVLKYTYGVNAWKHWVASKNASIEKSSTATNRNKLKFFKTDILACTADELNFSLCLFVKEVRKPNGEEYAPDSIYYLCLGIQQYLFENGRIDNIFTDIYCERFTECLNEVLSKYEVRLNAQGLIVCRIEEEHLWESKQLGAHSPHVLLNTLVYFNTKFFMLRSGEDHLKLSFSHIMKQWKKTNTATGKTPGRSVYLRYYAPTGQGPDAAKKKREDMPVFEQSENVDNPLRCPVKLYEFYLSKCPESIKNRNDVFYLVPERSCVPDSPVWYSTANLGIEPMMKMLNRLRLVREIQESMLHQNPYYCQ